MLALFAALMIVGKEALAALPNVEIVTVLIIALTHRYGARALWSVYTFVLVQLILYPVGAWSVAYLYVWAILVLAVLAVRRYESVLLYVIVAAIFGLLFGLLCSPPEIFMRGFATQKAYLLFIISGLPYDAIHCVSNALTTLLLFPIIYKVIKKA